MAKVKTSFLPTKQAPKTLPWLWANDDFEKKYPALYELLAAGLYEGEPRKGATVTLFVGDGRLKASVADRHTGNALWLTLEPFADVLAEIELAITSGKEAWKATSKNGATPVF
jgi:hypothetical protein